jgi:FtsP/CotA-like multicopper oxidase with cupredoxin domain
VLAPYGVVEPKLVWKDTVLIRTGQTVDVFRGHQDEVVDGVLIVYCHIAEHIQT